MDDVNTFPPSEAPLTPSERNTLSKLFGSPTPQDGSSTPSGSGSGKSPGWWHTIKLALMLTVVFLLIANPVSQAVFGLIPGVSSGMTEWILMGLLFFFAFIFIFRGTQG